MPYTRAGGPQGRGHLAVPERGGRGGGSPHRVTVRSGWETWPGGKKEGTVRGAEEQRVKTDNGPFVSHSIVVFFVSSCRWPFWI